jgi:hypothetical protein
MHAVMIAPLAEGCMGWRDACTLVMISPLAA